MDKYQCKTCGYVYNPKRGDPSSDIPPGTPFEKLPAGWVCPVCGRASITVPPGPMTIFTLGLLGFFFSPVIVLPILAWYFSAVYQDNVKRGRLEPNAMVNAALVLGKIGCFISVIIWLFYLLPKMSVFR